MAREFRLDMDDNLFKEICKQAYLERKSPSAFVEMTLRKYLKLTPQENANTTRAITKQKQ